MGRSDTVGQSRPTRLSPVQRGASAASIKALQTDEGLILRAEGEMADPWNHLEAAMALTVAGELEAAGAALEWLAAHQRRDGAWHAGYREDGTIADERLDTNGTAYLAVALRLHAVATGELRLVEALWPALRRAIGFVLAQQRPGGEIGWSDAPPKSANSFCLLAACSSIYASFDAALSCGELLARPWPGLSDAAERLGAAIRWRRSAFLAKDEYAMDWYYPVLSGVVSGAAGARRLRSGWHRFVREGQGVLCRCDQRWITTAEKAECALACLRVGLVEEAGRLCALTSTQRQRDGSYLTGLVYPERTTFPPGEASSYSAAAVLLADDALARGPAQALFAPATSAEAGAEGAAG